MDERKVDYQNPALLRLCINYLLVVPHIKKRTDQEILESYARTQSVWKSAVELGMCGQSIHERLKKLGASNPLKTVTEEQIQTIKDAYAAPFLRGESPLTALEFKLGMHRSNICRLARKLGLTSMNRSHGKLKIKAMKKRFLLWHQTHEHPRGMLGKNHTKESCDQMSVARIGTKFNAARTLKIMKTRFARYGTTSPNIKRGSWKSAWREIGGRRIFARSRWEANYARYLEWLKVNGQIKEWEHEPETFWFVGIRRGCCSYLPDFKVTENNGTVGFHEVKGWFDARSKTKIKRMAKYHPTVSLRIIAAPWFKENSRKLSGIIPNWENMA
jgi:hypothetical protein